jgi:hypothetical protein
MRVAKRRNDMSLNRLNPRLTPLVLISGLLIFLSGCNSESRKTPGPRSASVIEIAMPDRLGPMQRPATEFNHEKHVKALEKEGCQECHLTSEKKKLTPYLKETLPLALMNGLFDYWEKVGYTGEGIEVPVLSEMYTDFYHDVCMGCHQSRRKAGKKAGPEECGDCHQQLPPFESSRLSMRFDQSLHYRHVRAAKEKCETCHHIYNEKLKKLEYKKEKESSCRDCHGDRDEGRNQSWQNAAHTDCISCHIKKKKEAEEAGEPPEKVKKIGPADCDGCHDERKQKAIERLPKVPRLKRKQPDRIWVRTPGRPTSPWSSTALPATIRR